MNPKERIIVPIDTNNIDQALKMVHDLNHHVGMFKFGLELLNSMITQLVTSKDASLLQKVQCLFKLTEGKLFLDLKLGDIPNTVKGAAIAIVPLKPKMVTVHASSGSESIEAAVKNSLNSIVLGVTVLTSIGEKECEYIFGDKQNEIVLMFAEKLIASGARGIVCPPRELVFLEKHGIGKLLTKVIPGIRPIWAPAGDQKGVMTPKEAIKAGADYLVIGRPITNPPEGMTPLQAVEMICEEIEAVKQYG